MIVLILNRDTTFLDDVVKSPDWWMERSVICRI